MSTLVERLAEARLQAAIADGEFDGLAGAGAPLRLEDDSLVPAEWRPAFRLLLSAGLTPGWIADGKELRVQREALRAEEAPTAAWRARAAALNRRLTAHNLGVATPQAQIRLLRLEAASPPNEAARFAPLRPV